MTSDTDTQPGPEPGQPSSNQPHEGPRVSGEEMRDLSRLRRSGTDRHVAGVAGGLARHLDIDPVIVRVAFVVLVFFGGAGLVAYAALWLLVPEDGSREAAVALDDRSRAVALIGVAVLATVLLVGDWSGLYWFPWPLLVIGLVAWILITRRRDRRARDGWLPATDQPGTGYPGTGHPESPTTSSATGYAPPAPGATGWTPPPPRPRRHRRGPILFWPVLALAALGIGVLGMVDLAGVAVAASAYPAVVLGASAIGLLVGSVWGRSGGLIALGLVATLATAGATAAGEVEGTRVTEAPTSSAQVPDRWTLDRGEQVIDLTAIEDLDELDGRTLRVEGGVGRIEVIVPDDLTVDASATVEGPGAIRIEEQSNGGIDLSLNQTLDGIGSAPSIDLITRIGVGEIVVRVE